MNSNDSKLHFLCLMTITRLVNDWEPDDLEEIQRLFGVIEAAIRENGVEGDMLSTLNYLSSLYPKEQE